MTSYKQVEVHFEDPNPRKWCCALKEDVFANFITTKENSATVHKIFGPGSLFSPLLFGKFFDPSDAFPLWEFDSKLLLPSSNSSSQKAVDWFQTDGHYILKSQIPAVLGSDAVQVCVVKGEILEIWGEWRRQEKEWMSSRWWEHGYVRRVELPGQIDWTKLEAHVNVSDKLLEIKIPKIPPDHRDVSVAA